jgi:hypothetical protein
MLIDCIDPEVGGDKKRVNVRIRLKSLSNPDRTDTSFSWQIEILLCRVLKTREHRNAHLKFSLFSLGRSLVIFRFYLL